MLISINVNTAVNPPFNNGNSCLKTWLLSASYNTTMLWPSFDLRHNGSLKSSRLSIQASEITSLITVFLFEQHHFMLHLQTKVLPSFLTSSHLLWPISRQNFVLFRMETKKNLQFSFISFFFFLFLLMPLCDTLNLGLCSQHSLPPSGSVRATPPHLSALPPLFAIWFMLSVNVTVLFRKKKDHFFFWSTSSAHCATSYFIPSTKVIVKPLFSKVYTFVWFKNHYFHAFSWEAFLSVLVSFVNSYCIFNLPFPQYDPWRGRFYFSYLSSSQRSFQPGSDVINSTVAVLFVHFGRTTHFAFWTWLHWNLLHVCPFNS